MSKILLIIFFVGLVAILFFIKKYEDSVEKRKEQLHNFKKCKYCGQEIKSYKILNICSNCARKQTSKLYKYAGITIIAISFFAGLILADTFKTEKIDDAYFKYSYSDENDVDEYIREEFNIQLLLTSCACGLMIGLPLIGFSSIIYRLDLMIDK